MESLGSILKGVGQSVCLLHLQFCNICSLQIPEEPGKPLKKYRGDPVWHLMSVRQTMMIVQHLCSIVTIVITIMLIVIVICVHHDSCNTAASNHEHDAVEVSPWQDGSGWIWNPNYGFGYIWMDLDIFGWILFPVQAYNQSDFRLVGRMQFMLGGAIQGQALR